MRILNNTKLIVLSACVCLLLVGVSVWTWKAFFTNQSLDLSSWQSSDAGERGELLSVLIGDGFSKKNSETFIELPTTSPVYEMSYAKAVELLGTADSEGELSSSSSTQHQYAISYDVGNLTASFFGNLVVPQNAVLYLLFVEDKCVAYRLSI